MNKIKILLFSLLISLGVGGLSALLNMNSMDTYENIIKPILSPPPWVFPLVWTILFILMGISAYFIYQANDVGSKKALGVYALQLIFNFVWSFIFFKGELYLFSFIWLIFLWIFILWMIILFYKIKPLASLLQIPYLLWVSFAGYLNLMIYLLNC